VKNWSLKNENSTGLLLLLRKDQKISADESQLIDEALTVIHGPIQRALKYEDLFELARKDSLTGLANRRVFEERIHSLIESARRHNSPLTVVSMDLDRFKSINDSFGHAEGDAVLKKVASTLSSMTRGCDLLVRLGGDEFILLLPDTDLVSARCLAERIRVAIEQLEICAGASDKLGVSIGLSQWSAELTIEEWLQKTDELLYQAKDLGRHQVCC